MIRRLILKGNICHRTTGVNSYYSWPKGKRITEVEALISSFKKAFCNVTIQLEHIME